MKAALTESTGWVSKLYCSSILPRGISGEVAVAASSVKQIALVLLGVTAMVVAGIACSAGGEGSGESSGASSSAAVPVTPASESMAFDFSSAAVPVTLQEPQIALANGQVEGIFVNGQGSVSADPDTAILSMGITTSELTAEEAREEAAEIMKALTDSLKSNNVSEEDITIDYFGLNPRYDWDSNDWDRIIGYSVDHQITVKVRDLSLVAEVIDDAVTAGKNKVNIGGVSFTIDDQSDIMNQARIGAMEDALDKAQQLAGLADVSLGQAISISESSYFPGPVQPYYDDVAIMEDGMGAPSMDSPRAPTQLNAGQLEVSVSVSVIYAID